MIEISFQFPPEIKYLNFVEGSIDLFFKTVISNNNIEKISLLRSVLNEAFVNVIKHSKNKKDKIPIKFELVAKEFKLSISDYGNGLQINDTFPPYPRTMINRKYDLITVLDGKVKAIINDPYNCELIFESFDFDIDNKKNILDNLQDKGRGLSIMIKTMDSVKFSYSPAQTNTLIMSTTL